MKYERKTQALLPMSRFLIRLARSASIAAGIVFVGLGLGVLGYHYTENLPWIDALLNASMILSGMGPVNNPASTEGKLFASAYALFSGIIFLTVAAVVFGPVLHRLIHHFHLAEEDAAGERMPASVAKKSDAGAQQKSLKKR